MKISLRRKKVHIANKWKYSAFNQQKLKVGLFGVTCVFDFFQIS